MNGTVRGEVRRRLNALGKTRKKRKAEDEKWTEDVKEALSAARLAGIPMEEAAERLGLNRTTLYQVYLDPSEPREPEPA
jgi:transcriptional regulator of acetoin/glycerol metabolism